MDQKQPPGELDALAAEVVEATRSFVAKRLERQSAEVAGAIDALARVTAQLGERLAALERSR